jgi:hypothetical protein
VNVDTSLDRAREARMRHPEQLFPCHDATGVLAEGEQEVEFMSSPRAHCWGHGPDGGSDRASIRRT